MRIRFALLLVGILVLSVASVKADTIPPGDPEVDVGGGGTSAGVGNIFSFNVPADTSPCLTKTGFQCFAGFNNSGNTWTTLTIFFPTGTTGVTCFALAFFSTCNVIGNEAVFSGGTGIGPGVHFDVAVNVTNLTINALANPEPGTVTLFLTGIGALVARRRLRKV